MEGDGRGDIDRLGGRAGMELMGVEKECCVIECCVGGNWVFLVFRFQKAAGELS